MKQAGNESQNAQGYHSPALMHECKILVNPPAISKPDQMISINNTVDKKQRAALMILSFNDRSILETNTSEMLNFLENIIFGAFKLGGAKEKESYSLANPSQENVTIHALLMPQKGKPSELEYMGLWSFDKLNNFFLILWDKNLTRRIVESLEVKDPSIEN